MRAFLKTLHQYQLFTLSGGVLIANVIGVIMMPILARIYPTASFGFFAIYYSVATIVGTFSTFRLEAALPLARTDSEASGLIWLSLGSLLFFTILTFLILSFTPVVSVFSTDPPGHAFAYLTSISALALGLIQILAQVKIRRSDFKALSVRQVSERLCVALLSLLFAKWAFLDYGLAAAQTLGFVLSVCLLLLGNGELVRFKDAKIWLNDWKPLLYQYRDFPSKNLLSTGLQTLAGQLPPLVLSIFFSASQIGQLNLVQRLIDAPNSIVGSSLAVVYYRRLLNVTAEHRRRIFVFVSKWSILGLGLPGLGIMIFAKQITVLLLGHGWADASIFLSVLLPMGIMRMLYMLQQPLFLVTRRLDYDLFISGSLFFGNMAALLGFSILTHRLLPTIIASATINGFIYLIGLTLIGKLAMRPVTQETAVGLA